MTFMGFDDHQSMIDWLRRADEAAHSAITPIQEALTYGSYWVQFHNIADRQVVFGHVLTVDDARKGCIRTGGTTAECEAEAKEIDTSLQRGYMYGIAHSGWYPDGELGSTHKSVAWPIDEDLFEAARAVRFNIDALPLNWKATLELAFQAYRNRWSAA